MIKDQTGVTYGAAAFNIAKIYCTENKLPSDSNQFNWDNVMKVITRDVRRFMTWLIEEAPQRFEDIREAAPIPDKKEEILSLTRLNVNQRKRLNDLKDLKREMDKSYNRGQSFGLTNTLKEMNFTSYEIQALRDLNLYRKFRHPTEHRQYCYRWLGEEPTSKMVLEIDKIAYEKSVFYSKEAKRKKREKAQQQQDELRRQQELKRAERLALKNRKMKKLVNQGVVLDPAEIDVINTLKAKANGIKEENLFTPTIIPAKPIAPIQHIPNNKPANNQKINTVTAGIPIEVAVTTSGNKKTVSILIHI